MPRSAMPRRLRRVSNARCLQGAIKLTDAFVPAPVIYIPSKPTESAMRADNPDFLNLALYKNEKMGVKVTIVNTRANKNMVQILDHMPQSCRCWSTCVVCKRSTNLNSGSWIRLYSRSLCLTNSILRHSSIFQRFAWHIYQLLQRLD